MKIAIPDKITNSGFYLFTNEKLKCGDKVYPLTFGYVDNKNEYYNIEILSDNKVMTGWPDEPHFISDLNHSVDKCYQVKTDKGYGPIECYFKLIKHINNIA